MHLGYHVDLQEAQENLDRVMSAMGLRELRRVDEPNLRRVYYDIDDVTVDVRPEFLHKKMVDLHQHPQGCRLEFKLIATKSMPQP